MPRSYPVEVRRQVIELARAGTRVAQLAVTFETSEVAIYGRRHSALGMLTPTEYENFHSPTRHAA